MLLLLIGYFRQSAKLEFCTLPHKHIEEKKKEKKGRGSEDNKNLRDIDQDLIIYQCNLPLVVLYGTCREERRSLCHQSGTPSYLHVSVTPFYHKIWMELVLIYICIF